MPVINMIRIYPPPKYPLIHKAKRVFASGGLEAFQVWAASLSPQETEAVAIQLLTLLSDAAEVVRAEGKEIP